LCTNKLDVGQVAGDQVSDVVCSLSHSGYHTLEAIVRRSSVQKERKTSCPPKGDYRRFRRYPG
jgi:hypothetical protein